MGKTTYQHDENLVVAIFSPSRDSKDREDSCALLT